jgi:hypothetical protein
MCWTQGPSAGFPLMSSALSWTLTRSPGPATALLTGCYPDYVVARLEHDDVAAPDVAVGEKLGERRSWAENEFADEQVVADEDVFHRAGRFRVV